MKKYLNGGELAKFLQVSQPAISNWTRAGKIPKPRKNGRYVYHNVEDVVEAVLRNGLKVGGGIEGQDKMIEILEAFKELSAVN